MGPAPVGPMPGKKGGPTFIYGNYHRYYGYRIGREFSEDPRLALFDREWFTGRRCLDVGCNEGLVTLGVAAKFHTRWAGGLFMCALRAAPRQACKVARYHRGLLGGACREGRALLRLGAKH